MDNRKTIILAAAVTVIIFIFDIRTPVAYANWLLYFIPFFMAVPALRPVHIPVLSLTGTALVIASYFLSPPVGNLPIVISNRGMGIFVLWWVSYIVMKRKQAEEALRISYEELEKRVQSRTAELQEANVSLRREIAERRRAEESLKKLMKELERSNKDLEQFGYAISHDLQEPLRTVASYIDLLATKYRGKLDQKADQYISSSIAGAERMAALINDLLALSRITSRGGLFAPVEMDSVFREAGENLKKAIDDAGAIVTSDRLPRVSGDESQLVQLLQNLLGNAVKFRKKEVQPRIHVSAAPRGSGWVFGVRDNGIGIEPRFQERIFSIFQRLHTAQEYPGTGIGLALCRRIVERHGGRMWVESEAGEGSTFYFTLPGAS